ncbi:MmpS family transport accessory protein [Mycobacterium sp. Z3061]|uniref:MmpS family transport accessory protein n=1 Tax=Mycobacterium sp. Z3061 TaxID=3073562 RepID=UPI0028779730|nr:MmpS family transport accessory protein [Mycobacterium sp. Z3061]
MVRDLEEFPGDEVRAESYPQDFDDDPETDSWDEPDYETEEEWAWPADRRWRPIALLLGAVVAIGAIATAVIINSGDSATTKATVGVTPPRTAVTSPRSSAPPSATTSAPPTSSRAALPPETVTTIAPSDAPTKTAVPPTRLPNAAPAPTAAPPGATLNPRAVVYSVTGTKQLFDLVNIAYTDARGFPVTEFNVALPWTKVVVLNPGVQTESVIATSIYGQLNCSIVNAQGQLVKASTTNSALATCTR